MYYQPSSVNDRFVVFWSTAANKKRKENCNDLCWFVRVMNGKMAMSQAFESILLQSNLHWKFGQCHLSFICTHSLFGLEMGIFRMEKGNTSVDYSIIRDLFYAHHFSPLIHVSGIPPNGSLNQLNNTVRAIEVAHFTKSIIKFRISLVCIEKLGVNHSVDILLLFIYFIFSFFVW